MRGDCGRLRESPAAGRFSMRVVRSDNCGRDAGHRSIPTPEGRRAAFAGKTAFCAALACAFLLGSLGLKAQEVVVFKDSRAELVRGHRAEGAWTYLLLKDGEVGVATDQILEIRKATEDEITSGLPIPEPAKAPAAAPDTAPATAKPPNASPPKPMSGIKRLSAKPAKGADGGDKLPGKLHAAALKPAGAAEKKKS